MSYFPTDFTDPIAGAGGVDLFLAGSNLYGTPNILGQPSAVIKPQTWLDLHPVEYLRDVMKWMYSRDHYTGECASMRKITHYLIRKGVGETLEAYQERVALVDYTPHFAHIVDSLSGMMFGVEVDATRDLGKLGDPLNITSPIGKLWVDADGDHNGYLSIWKLLTTELIAIHDAWVFIDGGVDGKTPHVRLLPAEAVTNWRYTRGVLTEAVIRELADTRETIRDDPKQMAQRYIYATTDGWERWEKRVEKNTDAAAQTTTPPAQPGTREIAVKIEEMTPWTYQTVTGERTIPLLRVSLPLRRHVGFMLARKANAIFNKESERDHLLRFGAFPLLNIHGNDQMFKKITDLLKKGSRAIQVPNGSNPHAFIAPSVEPARMLQEALIRKVDELYVTGFREYGSIQGRSSGNSKTATEVRYDISTGIAAFLELLKSAVDDAENATFYLLEQTIYPDDKAKWGEAHVERSDDFVPFDINEVVERLRTRYFGQTATVPVGRSARIDAATQVAQWDGLDFNPDEIAADVDMQALQAALPLFQGLDIPPEAQAQMVVRFMVTTGYVDPKDKAAMAKLQAQALSAVNTADALEAGGGAQSPAAGGQPTKPKEGSVATAGKEGGVPPAKPAANRTRALGVKPGKGGAGLRSPKRMSAQTSGGQAQ